MPSIKGYNAEEAVAALKEAGFTNYKVEYDERIEAGKDEVVRQNPLQGSEIPSDYAITVVCSKGENKEKKVEIQVDMPISVTTEVKVTVLVDGVIDNNNSQSVIPAYSEYHTVTVNVKDDATIIVLLDDQQYREYRVNYDNNSVDLVNSYPYTPQATEPPTDAPDDEDETEPPSDNEEPEE